MFTDLFDPGPPERTPVVHFEAYYRTRDDEPWTLDTEFVARAYQYPELAELEAKRRCKRFDERMFRKTYLKLTETELDALRAETDKRTGRANA